MKEKLQAIEAGALAEIAQAADLKALDAARVKYLGKKGELTAILRGMGALSAEERPLVGQMVNDVRAALEGAISQRAAALKEQALRQKLQEETLDVTMPGQRVPLGKKHPLTIVLDEIREIFLGLGFSVAEGPEVELDYYNFEALGIPKNHPARDTQDTFYISDNIVLRTQTSGMQVRVMEAQRPPIRVIAPGRVYRSDAVDATHSPVFHQIEGLVVDRGITMSDLKGVLELFAKTLYGADTKVRFPPAPTSRLPSRRPRWTWPVSSARRRLPPVQGRGVDPKSSACGMVHPDVLSGCNVDPRDTTRAMPSAWGSSGWSCAAIRSTTSVCSMKTTCVFCISFKGGKAA